ncbi:uncharacterized protein LOC111258562 [Varroa jacobsoni]|uniref:uncharacterized protein LOC111258562 n=1 Tax=Varroa jacobsoni TaxID=62625 RepID=UPI000BF7EC1E|nr:uncharacterized protein LOC111258562 [Varroa jacobsoni]
MLEKRVPFPKLKSCEEIYIVSHLDTKIYAQLCIFPEQILTDISDEISKSAPAGAKFPNDEPSVGDLAVFVSQGISMRVVVVDVYSTNVCMVELLDHGGLQTVEKSSLEPLHEELIEKWPRVAVQIMLKESCHVVDDDIRTLEDIEVITIQGEYCLHARLIPKELQDHAKLVKAFFPEEECVLVPSPKLEETERVILVEINEAKGVVGVQLIRSDLSDKFNEFETEVQEKAERAKSMKRRPKRGEYVLAYSAIEPSWCRGLVTTDTNEDREKNDEGRIEVEFVDYGSFEHVPVSNIKALSADLARVEAFAVLLKLPDLKNVEVDAELDVRIDRVDSTDSLSRTWVATLIDTSGTTESSPAPAHIPTTTTTTAVSTVCGTTSGNSDGVHTTIPAQSPKASTGSMSSMNGAITLTEDIRDTEDVFVYFIGVDSTYGVQLKRGNVEAMEELLHELNSSSRAPFKSIKKGDFVVVEIDGTFCRALVQDINDGIATVRCVDYGSIDDIPVEKIWPLDPGYASDTPCMAFHCVLENASPKLELNKEYSLKILSRSVPKGCGMSLYSVARIDGKQDDSKTLDGSTIELPPRSYPPLELGAEEELWVNEIDQDNPTVIPVQLGKYNINELCDLSLNLTIKMQNGRIPVPINEISKGTLVAVRIEDENSCGFYRGIVCDLTSSDALVMQVDYGVLSKVPISDLALLPDEFVGYPQYGLRCSLKPDQLYLAKETSFIATKLEKCQKDGIAEYSFELKSDQKPKKEIQKSDEPLDTQTQMEDVSSIEGKSDAAIRLEESSEHHNELVKGSTGSIANHGSRVSVNDNVVTGKCSLDTTNHDNDDELATNVKYPVILDHAERMYITVDDGAHIGLQFCRVDELELENLNHAMTNYYKARSTKSEDKNVQVGDLVAFCDEGSFYRGEVTKIHDSEYTILSLDYGSMHVVPCCPPRLIKRFANLDRLGIRVPRTRFTETVDEYVDVILKEKNCTIAAYHPAALEEDVAAEDPSSEQVPLTNGDEAKAVVACSKSQETLENEASNKKVLNPEKDDTESTIENRNDVKDREEIKDACLVKPDSPVEQAQPIEVGQLSAKSRDHVNGIDQVTLAHVEDDYFSASATSLVATETSFDVFVTWLYSPTKVCVVKQSMAEVSQILSDRMAVLQNATDLRVIQPTVSQQLPVPIAVARIDHPRTVFHRVRLLSFDESTNLYSVFLVDTGEVTQVPGKSLFELPSTVSLDQIPALAIILNLRANDHRVRVVHTQKQPREILPIFDGILRCHLLMSGADEDVPGEICHLSVLCNERGDIVPQLFEEGMATFWSPRFVKNTLLLPRNGNEVEFVDARLLKVSRKYLRLQKSQDSRDTVDDGDSSKKGGQLRATLQLYAERQRIDEILENINKTALTPLFTHHVGTPAIIEVPVSILQSKSEAEKPSRSDRKWVRGKVVARHTPVHYTIRLIDYGIDVSSLVKQTFRCPAIALHVPEAIAEVTVKTSITSPVAVSSFNSEAACSPTNLQDTINPASDQVLDRLERQLQNYCGKEVIVRCSLQRIISVCVELFDSDGNSIFM